MTLNQLLYFRTISQTGSMGQAARQLYLSQPSLSVSLSRLEEELGVSLFDRIGHHLELTPDGEIFLDYADKILQKADEAVSRMHLLSESHDRLLRLGCIEPAFNKYVPYIMRRFLDLPENADTKFELFTDTTDVLVQRLKSGELDLLISSVSDSRDVQQTLLYTMPLALLGPRGLKPDLSHSSAGNSADAFTDTSVGDFAGASAGASRENDFLSAGTYPTTWEKIAGLPLIGYTSGSSMDHLLARVAADEKISLNFAYLAPNEEAIAALVYHGFGYGIVPVTDTLAANKDISLYPLPGHHYQTICLTSLANRRYRGAAARFTAFMKESAPAVTGAVYRSELT